MHEDYGRRLFISFPEPDVHNASVVTSIGDIRMIGLGQRYVGKIDELLIADTALSDEQVHSLFELGGNSKTLT